CSFLRTLLTTHSSRPHSILFFFHVPAPTATYTLSLHDALPIFLALAAACWGTTLAAQEEEGGHGALAKAVIGAPVSLNRGLAARDRKSTRLNSSHVAISYAVFCLKKKKTMRA